MDYFRKHWRGELPLATSFFINVFLLNIVIRVVQNWLTKIPPVENPVWASRIVIAFFVTTLTIVYPWQIIGLWRSANRYASETKTGLWSGVTKTIVVLGFLATLSNLSSTFPVYKTIYKIGFEADEFGDYNVELINDGSLIHLRGPLGFGISDEVRRLIDKNQDVKGIILDSVGGRLYEGRELSKIISINGLDTYTLKGCYSACVTAFISGKNRYVARGANLAFHQYRSFDKSVASNIDISSEQEKDILIFKKQGINQDFIDRIFNTKNDDLWYPTIDEMLTAGVFHEFVSPSNLKPINYGKISTSDIEKEFNNIPVYQAIRKYEPEIYQKIIIDIEAKLRKGLSIADIQHEGGKYLEIIGTKYLPKTSDKALILFVTEINKILTKLEKEDPILCMKYLFPNQYGPLRYTNYLSNEETKPLVNALSRVIEDSYIGNNTEIDIAEADKLMASVISQLGDNASYLNAEGLQTKEDYSKTCKTVIRFYDLILAHEDNISANTLRYALSP